jgi:hypothetical protein
MKQILFMTIVAILLIGMIIGQRTALWFLRTDIEVYCPTLESGELLGSCYTDYHGDGNFYYIERNQTISNGGRFLKIIIN